MRTFKVHCVVKWQGVCASRTPSEFVDWYEAENEAEARKLWEEDAHRYGVLPADGAIVEATVSESQTCGAGDIPQANDDGWEAA